jgi:hypothetical protein
MGKGDPIDKADLSGGLQLGHEVAKSADERNLTAATRKL